MSGVGYAALDSRIITCCWNWIMCLIMNWWVCLLYLVIWLQLAQWCDTGCFVWTLILRVMLVDDFIAGMYTRFNWFTVCTSEPRRQSINTHKTIQSDIWEIIIIKLCIFQNIFYLCIIISVVQEMMLHYLRNSHLG